MLKIRRPTGRLIFNMGIPIPGKTVFLIETGPWRLWKDILSVIIHHHGSSSLMIIICWFISIFIHNNSLFMYCILNQTLICSRINTTGLRMVWDEDNIQILRNTWPELDGYPVFNDWKPGSCAPWMAFMSNQPCVPQETGDAPWPLNQPWSGYVYNKAVAMEYSPIMALMWWLTTSRVRHVVICTLICLLYNEFR